MHLLVCRVVAGSQAGERKWISSLFPLSQDLVTFWSLKPLGILQEQQSLKWEENLDSAEDVDTPRQKKSTVENWM